jgi:hypothetical protein
VYFNKDLHKMTKLNHLTLVLVTAFALTPALAQHDMRKLVSTSDAQKIVDAMRAAPPAISKNATIIDWPAKPGEAGRRLREGTNKWVCYPRMSPTSNDPMCLDKQWQILVTALLTKTNPSITGVGLAYMLKGDSGASNTDPYDMGGPTATNAWVVSPPHMMIVFPDPRALDVYPTDPKAGGPWVMWKGTPYAHLMVPVSLTLTPKMPAPKKGK